MPECDSRFYLDEQIVSIGPKPLWRGALRWEPALPAQIGIGGSRYGFMIPLRKPRNPLSHLGS
jgi:hypothetical protein